MLLLVSPSDAASGERVESITLWDQVQAPAAVDETDPPSNQAVSSPITASSVRDFEVALSAGMQGGTVARFISAHLHPGNIDTVVALFENVVMHAATAQQGFRRGLLLVDRASDNVISIGLWQSETDLRASEQTGYLAQQIGNFTEIVATSILPDVLLVVAEE
jgi:hypothetical protein